MSTIYFEEINQTLDLSKLYPDIDLYAFCYTRPTDPLWLNYYNLDFKRPNGTQFILKPQYDYLLNHIQLLQQVESLDELKNKNEQCAQILQLFVPFLITQLAYVYNHNFKFTQLNIWNSLKYQWTRIKNLMY